MLFRSVSQSRYCENKQDEEEEVIEEDPIEKLLASKQSDEPVTADELRRAFALKKQQDLKRETNNQKKQDSEQSKHRKMITQIQEAEQSMRQVHTDYDEAVKLAVEMMNQYGGLRIEYNQIARDRGALAAVEWGYNLGKTHKNFGVKKVDPQVKAREDAKKVIENANKQKTSASMSNGDKKPLKYNNNDLENMESEELAKTLANMSQGEYSKVPKSIRKKAMQAL